MTKITLILGGARSGKSSYAEQVAAEQNESVLYIATAEAKDADMAQRIANHQASRPTHWHTVEAPQQIAITLQSRKTLPAIWLLDCLTLLVSNILLSQEEAPLETISAAVQAEIEALLTLQRQHEARLIIVSNEVGLGLVPAYQLGRIYRDLLGRANQQLAAQADRVLFMVAGIPMTVK